MNRTLNIVAIGALIIGSLALVALVLMGVFQMTGVVKGEPVMPEETIVITEEDDGSGQLSDGRTYCLVDAPCDDD